ncbi:MAG: hypothetical protein QOE92_1513 [Chloroflexota bacterium]|nr:hypothetical protein [Chloroflexota bacterium]
MTPDSKPPASAKKPATRRKTAARASSPAPRRTPRAAASPASDVILYGATGYTGRLAAAAMEKAGVAVMLAGRNRETLERMAEEFGGEYPVGVAAHDDPAALAALAGAGRVMVSTAGPFSEVGELTVAAAVSAGISYLDSTGEGDFMRRTHLRHDAEARRKKVVVVNACAFEYVIGDCAVALALDAAKDPSEVRVSYWLPTKTMTHGTLKSANGVLFSGGTDRDLFKAHKVDFPDVGEKWAVTYPGGEVEFLRRRRPELKVSTLMDLPPLLARSAGIMPRIGPALALPPIQAAMNALVSRMPSGPSPEARAKQEWIILVEVDPGTRKGSSLVVRGADPYGLTGEILARGASRVLAGKTLDSGVLAPSEAFAAGEMLDSLADVGVSWERL